MLAYENRVVSSSLPVDASPAAIQRRYRALLGEGYRLMPAGQARADPTLLLARRFLPRHLVELFDTSFYLTDYRFDEALGFLIGYVVRDLKARRDRRIHPRVFYKDSSLIWRVASHYVHDEREYWIGKGDVRWEKRSDGEYLCSAEETANLPFELQTAFDLVSRKAKRSRQDDAIELLVREAPSKRIAPYADFSAPRRRAAARFRIHRGRPVVRFRRRGDPSSLVFAPGFEPDFRHGVLEEASIQSRFFGGRLRKFRILSANRCIQYLFMASPTHAWVNPPQALTTELSTFGVRTIDVLGDEDAFVPGYEYHDASSEDPEHSQIPAGFAGAPHPQDPERADASRWLEALPVIQAFRKQVLERRRRHA